MSIDVYPVKLVTGALVTDHAVYQKGIKFFTELYGPVDYESEPFPFLVSDYYHEEMGSPITRYFLAFEKLVFPDELAKIKIRTNAIENRLAVKGKRKVNFDPGYMDFNKVVLASVKYNWQKIYLSSGIWADLALRYEKGRFSAFPWSFPDFKENAYNSVFLNIRQIYKKQVNL